MSFFAARNPFAMVLIAAYNPNHALLCLLKLISLTMGKKPYYMREVMGTRRQPSKRFLRILKGSSESSSEADTGKQLSPIQKFRQSDAWIWTEIGVVGIGVISLAYTAFMTWVDLGDRETQRIVQAWALVTQDAPGNSGKGPALEYLASQGIPLRGVDLSGEDERNLTYLREVDLSEADFSLAILSRTDLLRANLSNSNFVGANLSSSNLAEANLSGAFLFNTKLTGAFLENANLTGAVLSYADLSKGGYIPASLRGAIFDGANLSGAKLADTKDLTQMQLDTACGSERTELPAGLTIKTCTDIRLKHRIPGM